VQRKAASIARPELSSIRKAEEGDRESQRGRGPWGTGEDQRESHKSQGLRQKGAL